MSIYRRRYQAILTAFWLVLVVFIWVLFAPLQVGGQAAYVIVAGQSMEPNLHLSDLVIVHKASGYQVGDVVAYQNADIDRYVIHRIVSEKQGRFLMRGDSNTWIDNFEPTRQQILGKLWIHLPRFGIYIQKLREPNYMALIAGLIGSLVAATLFVSNRREKHHMEENSRKTELNIRKGLATLVQKIRFGKWLERFSGDRSQGPEFLLSDKNPMQNRGQDRNALETLFFALAVAALLSLLLGIITFTRPVTQTVSDDISYQQLGFFSYSAAAPAGVYDTATIQSGEPIFPKLTCSINITFNYTLVAAPSENIGGSYQLTAILKHPQSGWQRTFPLQEQTSFTGNAFDTQADLNLCEIVRLIDSVEEVTDSRAGLYALSINPQVQIAGSIADRPLEATFEPNLVFQYDRTQFYLVNQSKGSDPLHPSEANILQGEKRIPNTLALFGTEFNVPALRTISVIGLVLSLSGFAILWLQLENTSRKNPETFVRMKYDPLIIDVQEGGLNDTTRVIDVNTIDDLAKLAEKHNAMILHEAQDSVDNYIVHVDGNSYAYSQAKKQPESIPGSIEIYRANFDNGMNNGEFEVHYQPVVSLVDGRITAVEALLRWRHPQRGLLSAGKFIQFAEMTGRINKLDEWVLQVACAQLKEWRDTGYDLKLAVNLSNYFLEHESAERLQRILENTDTKPSWLQIEIPETKMTRSNPMILLELQKIRELGVNITIDDFVGDVGLSSISQIQINSVKIDRLLVKKMGNPQEAVAMQRMITVATTLGMNVVGKGVETDEEKVFLANTGSQAQGFLLGRPVPAHEIAELLQQNAKLLGSGTRKKSTGK
jgi:signal peptidase I